MKRLTENAIKPSINAQYIKRSGVYTAECIERLGSYEDIGLTPGEIKSKLAIFEERESPSKPQEVLLACGKGYECSNCGNELSVSEFDGVYCHWCGQKLDWEN